MPEAIHKRMAYEEQTCGDCHKEVAVVVQFATRKRDLKKLIYRCAACASKATKKLIESGQDAKEIERLRKKIEAWKKTC